MRIFIVLIFLAFQTLLSAGALAQDEASPPAQSSAKKKTVYDKATDAQIKEAQSFYDFCTEDEAMLQDYDCKCAASTYLDSRIKLGSKATKREIVRTIGNKCPASKVLAEKPEAPDGSASKNSSGITENSPDIDMSNVTDQQLEEAQEVYAECKSNFIMDLNHDCRCMASTFLSKRIELGPVVSKNNILVKFRNLCKNVVATTGYEYTSCMANTSLDYYRAERKSICECYARKWADLYEKSTMEMTSMNKNDLKLQAMTLCTRGIPTN